MFGLLTRLQRLRDPFACSVIRLTEAEYRARFRSYAEDDEVVQFRAARERNLVAVPQKSKFIAPGFEMLLAAIDAFGGPARILDFGGSFGFYGGQARKSAPRQIESYTVLELPALVESAKKAGFDDVDFITEMPPKGSFDIVFCSGTIQYMDDPIGALRDLASLDARCLVLARNFFADERMFFLQRSALFDHGAGPVPSGFQNRLIDTYVQAVPFEEAMATMRSQYEVTKTVKTPGAVRSGRTYGRDLLLRRFAC